MYTFLLGIETNCNCCLVLAVVVFVPLALDVVVFRPAIIPFPTPPCPYTLPLFHATLTHYLATVAFRCCVNAVMIVELMEGAKVACAEKYLKK